VTDADIAGFAAVSGDLNPTHLDDAYARGEGLRGKTAHGMWSGAMVSTLLGTVFPGPGHGVRGAAHALSWPPPAPATGWRSWPR
jgi:acyl dehydratase